MNAAPVYEAGVLLPGTVYRVVRELGAGGMGRVYEVCDTTLGKRFALKTLLEPSTQSHDVVLRMAVESRALVRIEHPNVVNVFTAGVTREGAFYYVMELLNGSTLREVLSKRYRLELRFALPIALAMASGLERAHRAGVIHRDIKPENIFMALQANRTTRVKLVDFGVAGFLNQLRGVQEAEGMLIGTPLYASPEQQRGERPSPAMDIWSFGMVLFEMLAGRGPFPGETLAETFAAVQSDAPSPRLDDVVQGLPLRVTQLVAAMLEKNPARRPASMADVRGELLALQSGALATGSSTFGVITAESPGTLASSAHPNARSFPSLMGPLRTRRTLTAPGQRLSPVAPSSRGPSEPDSVATRMCS